MWLVNTAGIALMAGIVWWFWLWKPKTIAAASANPQTVIVESGSYKPARVVVPVGRETTLHFLRKDPSPCASTVVLAEWGIAADLPLDVEVAIQIIPAETGVFPFSCQMQMYRGEVHVVADGSLEKSSNIG